jgi:energy-coupling factor transporter transmembrane protein EcfT
LKFRLLCLLFNGIILLFIALIFFIPFIVFGAGFALIFWRSSWPLGAVLVLILLGINGYYFANRRLFLLLEREDWPALVQYLEGRVFQDRRWSPNLVRLLANTYLVLSDSGAVMSLERRVAAARPVLVDANALLFGVARILCKDNAGAARFFSQRLDSSKTESAEWVRWYYGFSLLLDRQFAAAGEQFSLLVHDSRDAVITGISAYFLAGALRKALPEQDESYRFAADGGRARVRRALPSRGAWQKETGKLQTEVYAVVLLPYIGEAADWLYEGAAA